jgi:hypothetical protein
MQEFLHACPVMPSYEHPIPRIECFSLLATAAYRFAGIASLVDSTPVTIRAPERFLHIFIMGRRK